MGEYIFDRWMPDAIRQACDALGFSYTTYSDDWIVKIQGDDKLRWVFGYGFDLNAFAASQNANDKVACYQVLSDANIPALPHLLLRAEVLTEQYVQDLREKFEGRDIVLKPLTGTGGRDITRHSSIDETINYMHTKERPDWCVSPFVDIQSEKRIFMLDGDALVSYDKIMPVDEGGILYYNLGKGAQGVVVEPSAEELSLAKRTLAALGIRVASVDIITLLDGTQQIIEINSGITMEHFMRQSEEYKAIGYEVYRKIVTRMME